VSVGRVSVSVGALVAVVLAVAPAGAYPLGNRYTGIEIERDAVQIRYLIDMAEIPAFQDTRDPVDHVNRPPRDVQAPAGFKRETTPVVSVSPAPPVGPQPDRPLSSAGRFTDLIARPEAGAGVVAVALMVAAALGALHGLEPGHGKTVVAAYLVGSRGTARHALILGLIVTVSHTAGVYLLGGVTFFASQHVVPERLYPWLSLASGLTIAILGAALFHRHLAGAEAGHGHHQHAHAGDEHRHDHARDAHGHSHSPGHGHHDHDGPVSLRALVALGVSGGIVPCPAALVVLLGALSMHRVGFGLVLIVAFSVGLAAVLVVIGILMVYAGRLMSRFHEDGPWINRWLPLASSAVMTLLGVGIMAQAVVPWIPR
jgi:ABC-type nickel/cobalt efflux system permease component RcnA